MSKSKRSKPRKFKLVVTALLLLSSVGLALAGLVLSGYFAHQAIRLSQNAQVWVAKGKISHAIVDLTVASWISPTNHQAIQQLGDLYLLENRPDDAVQALKRLPKGESGLQIASLQRQMGELAQSIKTLDDLMKGNPTAGLLTSKSQVQLEQGSANDAVVTSEQALSYAQDSRTQLQLGLAYAVGEHDDKLVTLIASVTAPETLQALKQAQSGKIPLAHVLYATGLLRSSERILVAQSNLNPTDHTLLGHIELILSANNHTKLAEAVAHLEKATHQDPANQEAHRLLQQAYEEQGNVDGSTHQAELVRELETGKI